MIQYKTVGGNMQIFKEEKVDIEDALGNLKSAILSYIPFLNLIPYFKKTDSPFVEFHSKQGVTLFIFEMIYGILSFIFMQIKIPVCEWGMCNKHTPIYIIIPLVILGLIMLTDNIIGLYNVITKKQRTLPIIGFLFN